MKPSRLTPLLVAALALPGCGEGPSETDKARDAADRVFATKNARELCTRQVTARFVDDYYAGRTGTCIAKPFNREGGKPVATKARLADVTGDRARVAVRVESGSGRGAAGHVALVRRDGGKWRLDGFGSDFERSQFRTSVANSRGDSLVAFPSVRRCFARQARTLSDRQIHRLVVLAAQDSPRLRDALNDVGERCPEALAEALTDAVVKALRKSQRLSATQTRCIERELLFYLRSTGLARQALRGNDNAIARSALQGILTPVRQKCVLGRR